MSQFGKQALIQRSDNVAQKLWSDIDTKCFSNEIVQLFCR